MKSCWAILSSARSGRRTWLNARWPAASHALARWNRESNRLPRNSDTGNASSKAVNSCTAVQAQSRRHSWVQVISSEPRNVYGKGSSAGSTQTERKRSTAVNALAMGSRTGQRQHRKPRSLFPSAGNDLYSDHWGCGIQGINIERRLLKTDISGHPRLAASQARAKLRTKVAGLKQGAGVVHGE